MIIVEGPDGSGKTTLVNRISKDWEVIPEPKVVSSEAKALVNLDDFVENELTKGFGFRLYDRFSLISAPIYSVLPDKTFKGRFNDVNWLRAQYSKWYKLDPVVILCLPSKETVLGNTRADPNNEVVFDHIDTIYDLYLNWYASQVNNSSVMIWDYHNPNGLQLANLLRWAKARSDRGR